MQSEPAEQDNLKKVWSEGNTQGDGREHSVGSFEAYRPKLQVPDVQGTG